MPVDEALARVLAGVPPLPAEYVAIADAHERVLAAELAALRTQPPADMSSMDGYAVRGADLTSVPVRLRLVGEVPAGRVFERPLVAGEAVRILTGGVVPAGADTIIIQENTRREGEAVIVHSGEPPGRYIRRAGLDFCAGDLLLRAGRRLTVRDLALAAAMNHAVVPVRRRPRVAVLSTGDELRPPGSALAPGQIISSNGLALAALARAEGATALDFGVVPDRLDATVAAIRRARDWGANVLLTAGGASVGDYDLVQDALTTEGMALSFWKVALRPGKPLMHARLGTISVLGLPGNPVSAQVCALLFLVPLLRHLQGRGDLMLATETARLGRDMPANDERQDYVRGTLADGIDGVPIVTPLGVQDSSLMRGLAGADALLIRPPHAPAAAAGAPSTILRLRH